MAITVEDIARLSNAERRALVTFVKTGTLTEKDTPGLTRAERRQLRKQCARLALLVGHDMRYQRPESTVRERMSFEVERKWDDSIILQCLNPDASRNAPAFEPGTFKRRKKRAPTGFRVIVIPASDAGEHDSAADEGGQQGEV